MRPVSSSKALLALLAAATLASASTCEPPAPVDEPRPVTFLSVGDNRLEQARRTTISITSLTAALERATGDVTVTVAPGVIRDEAGDVVAGVTVENAASVAPATVDPTEPTATATLENGQVTFGLLCNLTGRTEDVEVAVSIAGPNGTTAATVVVCTPQEIARTLTFSTADCQARLQADGASTCAVEVTVQQDNIAAPGVSVDIVVESVLKPNGDNGNAAVLATTATATRPVLQRLDGLETDSNGVVRFFLYSPALNLEQTIKLVASDDVGNSGEQTFDIAPFQDKSQVSIVAIPASISSGGTTNVTVTGRALNGDLVTSGTAQVEVTGPLTATVGGCLAEDGGAFRATLTSGVCSFNLVAATIGTEAEVAQIVTTFRANASVGDERIASTTVTVNPANISLATVALSESLIFADAQPPSTTLTVNVSRDGIPRQNSRVTATVASDSRGVVKLLSSRVGTAAPVAVPSEDEATVIAGPDGVVSFTVGADNPISRGNGRITIAVIDPATNRPFDVVSPDNVTVTVDRAPQLKSLFFVAFDGAPEIGVPGGPRGSSTGVIFRLLDEQNQAVPNVPVRFAAQSSVPGVAVVPFGESEADGTVKTVVTAGSVAGPVTVVAIVGAPPNELRAVSQTISVVGGLPNSAYTSLVCDKIAGASPSSSCKVTLADKFTNLATTTTRVQFRAEGGNITPSADAAAGVAAASFLAGPPGTGSADVQLWTNSPLRNAPAAVRSAFPGCFDATIRTPCDLYALCSDESDEASLFCPLPPSLLSSAPAKCTPDIDPLALEALAEERLDAAEWEFALFTGDQVVVDQFTAYVDTGRACGLPLSCLVGDLDGLELDPSDDCPVNPGCLDYSGATECPQEGLIDIMAAVRGEEAFDDQDGDGTRDADEDFVDFPEPFLDKNSSCSFDSLNDHPRLSASQKVQLSDLFIDSSPDTDGRFGFVTGGQRTETNGVFDSDTEIFMKTAIVQLGPAILHFGAAVEATACGATGVANVSCPAAAQAREDQASRCTETAGGAAILRQCVPGPTCGDVTPTCPEDAGFRDQESASLVFRWFDPNGNCPTEDFAGTPAIAADGPVEIVAFDEGPYSPAECGGLMGSPIAKNVERPWCEEHPFLGAPLRGVTISANCGSETGDQLATLRFTLDDAVFTESFTVNCPVCGDSRVEGEETCDDGNLVAGDDCGADCQVEEEAAP
jgi:cysteine-rich repeat protein